ncbi:MAG: type II secretion system secretin GspD [Deltaproteobacteria bacterium]|nr:type II secretion system secretin GspD [Deltaproteobacteria bacterium]
MQRLRNFSLMMLLVSGLFGVPKQAWSQARPTVSKEELRKRREESRKRRQEHLKQARELRRARGVKRPGRLGKVTPPKFSPAARPAIKMATKPGLPVEANGPAKQEGMLPGEKEFNECVKLPPGRKIKITLKPESDLTDLVGWISSMTCKRFILASNLRSQKVTIISPAPVTVREAYRAFISALDVMGLTVVPSGRYLKVVQGNWAIQSSIPTFTNKQRGRLPSSDQIITQIIQVEHVDVNDILLVFNKMKSRSGDITAYRPSNSLIITDGANRVRRMLGILKELDVPVSGEKIWVVRLRNADAEETSKILTQVFAKQARGSKSRPKMVKRGAKKKTRSPAPKSRQIASADAVASKVITDPASNSLIIVATPSAFAQIAALIKKLDVAGEGVNQRIHVHYLENGDAEEMAATLAGLTQGAAGRRTTSRTSRRGSTARPKARKSGGTTATLFEGDVKITADKATNSLVIVASSKDFLALRRVIKRLDIPRRQVFIEAVIMEVSLDKSNKLGFAYHGGKLFGEGDSQSIGFGGVQHSSWQSMLIDPLSLMGLAAGARGALVEGSAELMGVSTDIPGFGVMFQALQLDNNINVLSSPHILTTDNVEAEITVGQNLPFQGAFTGGGLGAAAGASSFLPQVSVQRQDVALKLKITPHVNASDMVRLELDQEVSDISSPNFNGLGPATSKRTAKTTVVVRDQQTVVIGGMMQERQTNEVSKVPLLGDIPVLGYLFKYTTKSKVKTNLLIVLTPYVIRDQSDLRRIFKRKLKERREFIERYTSFKPHEISHQVDFRHKRGLLSEINRVGMQVEEEVKLLEQSKPSSGDDVEPVDMPKGLVSSGAAPPSAANRLPGKAPSHNPGLNPKRSGRLRVRPMKK